MQSLLYFVYVLQQQEVTGKLFLLLLLLLQLLLTPQTENEWIH